MPLYDYKCLECKHRQEHYLSPNSEKILVCPKCNSESYSRQVNTFTMNVEYGTARETIENKIDPSVRDLQAQIGRETLDQDTKTLDNIYGKEKVERTFYGSSE